MKKIAIIGAGISGLYLANLFKGNKDQQITIYEKKKSIVTEEGYGIQLSVNSIKLLNKIGFNSLPEEEKFNPKKIDFYEIKNFSIKELFKITDKKVQTITYFGYKQKDFEKSLKDYLPIGIDRIVPIGQSFKMNFIWDGYDMINSLSRKIEIK